jgi:hypothetical protein
MTEAEEVQELGRALYLRYCQVKAFRPTPAPYVPAWALDYARVALAWVDGEEQ